MPNEHIGETLTCIINGRFPHAEINLMQINFSTNARNNEAVTTTVCHIYMALTSPTSCIHVRTPSQPGSKASHSVCLSMIQSLKEESLC